MTTSAAQALFDELERGDAARWQPEAAGDRFAGRFVRVSAGRTRYADVAPVMTLADDETGELREVWLNQKALREKIFKAKPQRGELVAILYEGTKTPRGGGDDYHVFRVLVERAAGAQVDWEAIADAVETQNVSRPWYRHPTGDETDWAFAEQPAAGGAEQKREGRAPDAPGEPSQVGSAPPAADAGEAPQGLEVCPVCKGPWPHHEAGCTEEIPF